MAAVLAPRRAHATRPFGRPEGLRALATLAFAVCGSALSFAAARGLFQSTHDADQRRFLSLVLAVGASVVGFGLVARAAEAARAIEERNAHPGRRRRWGLVTLLAGLGVLGQFALHVWVLRRLDTDALTSPVGMMAAAGLLAVGMALVVLGGDALRRSRMRFDPARHVAHALEHQGLSDETPTAGHGAFDAAQARGGLAAARQRASGAEATPVPWIEPPEPRDAHHRGHGLAILQAVGSSRDAGFQGPYGRFWTPERTASVPSVRPPTPLVRGVSRHSVETSEMPDWMWIGLGIVVGMPILYGILVLLGFQT